MQAWTPSGVRMRLHSERDGALDWLLLPGGPGVGSESLEGLASAMDVSGRVWLVDLPGDGSNVSPPGATADPYAKWPHVLIEAAQAVPRPVYVGHSTGGMYLLSVPELEARLAGLVLVSSAPDAKWMQRFAAMTAENPLPAAAAAMDRFNASRTNDDLRTLCVASAPWSFTSESLRAGEQLLGRMPINVAAMAWSAASFDDTYESTWWPASLPTLIVSGASDRVVDQSAWDEVRFAGPHVTRRTIEGAAHFPWMERPARVRDAFAELEATFALLSEGVVG